MMLLLLQAAELVLTNGVSRVYLTLQQPPGIPEWMKITITAGVGSLFGILASLLVELVKPWLSRKTSKKFVRSRLLNELRGNITAIDGFPEFLDGLGKTTGVASRAAYTLTITHAMFGFDNSWFDSSFKDKKEIVLGLDFFKEIKDLYLQAGMVHQWTKDDFDTPTAAYQMNRINLVGRKILEDNRIAPEARDEESWADLYRVYLDLENK